MSIALNITGTLELSIFNLDGSLLNDEQEKEVYVKLGEGIYLISLSSKTISTKNILKQKKKLKTV